MYVGSTTGTLSLPLRQPWSKILNRQKSLPQHSDETERFLI